MEHLPIFVRGIRGARLADETLIFAGHAELGLKDVAVVAAGLAGAGDDCHGPTIGNGAPRVKWASNVTT